MILCDEPRCEQEGSVEVRWTPKGPIYYYCPRHAAEAKEVRCELFKENEEDEEMDS